ncbi:hypothetical protein D3M70_17695 [Pseudomonas sp. LS-2]|jgi:hypothetical protein|nr:hypothetical protein D3M70_17695 [Pseudomonas sp. LS-2]
MLLGRERRLRLKRPLPLPIGGVMTDFIAFEMSAMNVIIPPFACPVSSHAVMPEIRAHDP